MTGVRTRGPDYQGQADEWTPKAIRALRVALSETQTKFAGRLHVSLNAVQKWEAGDAAPSPLSAMRLRLARAALLRRREAKGAQ